MTLNKRQTEAQTNIYFSIPDNFVNFGIPEKQTAWSYNEISIRCLNKYSAQRQHVEPYC